MLSLTLNLFMIRELRQTDEMRVKEKWHFVLASWECRLKNDWLMELEELCPFPHSPDRLHSMDESLWYFSMAIIREEPLDCISWEGVSYTNSINCSSCLYNCCFSSLYWIRFSPLCRHYMTVWRDERENYIDSRSQKRMRLEDLMADLDSRMFQRSKGCVISTCTPNAFQEFDERVKFIDV